MATKQAAPWPPAPKPVIDTRLVRVIHDGRVKFVRACDLIDPAIATDPKAETGD